MSNACHNCKSFSTAPRYGIDPIPAQWAMAGWGLCKKADTHGGVPDNEPTLAWAEDPDSSSAVLRVAPTFHCAMWEAKA